MLGRIPSGKHRFLILLHVRFRVLFPFNLCRTACLILYSELPTTRRECKIRLKLKLNLKSACCV